MDIIDYGDGSSVVIIAHYHEERLGARDVIHSLVLLQNIVAQLSRQKSKIFIMN